MRVGVLAVQGGFAAHARALAELGHVPVELREPSAVTGVDGLVLPGGESTVQLQLCERWDLEAALSALVRAGKPVLATCAGLILAARRVTGPAQRSFAWLDVDVVRNAWGRQLDSFTAHADRTGLPLTFIRAPRITTVGPGAEILESYAGEPVLVRQLTVHGATFHPELTADRSVHRRVFGVAATSR